jgi:hypothetical protein
MYEDFIGSSVEYLYQLSFCSSSPMEYSMAPLRYLSPRNHDRIVDLLSKEPCDHSLVMKAVPTLQMIQSLSRTSQETARIKFETLLATVEKHVMKKNGFNIMIRNIPNFAQMSETDEKVAIKYVHMRDTLRKFGNLIMFHMIRGTVYAKFADQESCTMTHSLINNMMMGDNIINSEVIV